MDRIVWGLWCCFASRLIRIKNFGVQGRTLSNTPIEVAGESNNQLFSRECWP